VPERPVAPPEEGHLYEESWCSALRHRRAAIGASTLWPGLCAAFELTELALYEPSVAAQTLSPAPAVLSGILKLAASGLFFYFTATRLGKKVSESTTPM
jgi:hypothetical protein